MTQDSVHSPPSSGGFPRCPDCGARLADDQRYCLNCGATVRDVLRGLLPARPYEPSPLARARYPAVPGGTRGAAAALACALSVGALAGAAAVPGTASPVRRVVVVASAPVAPVAAVTTPSDLAGRQPVARPPSVIAPAPDTAPPPLLRRPPDRSETSTPTGAKKKRPASTTDVAETKPAPIEHVVVVALADKGFAEAFGPATKAPYLGTELRERGTLLRRYHATSHGSLPNLIGLLSGQGANPEIATGCAALTSFVVKGKVAPDGQLRGKGCVFPAQVRTLPAQLEAKNLSWRGYVEGADQPAGAPPAPCRPPAPAADGSPAAVDRNPFLFFAGIAAAPDCTAKVTGFGALAADLTVAPARAPALSVILPGACLAGREGACPAGEPDGLARADAWLREFVPQLLAAPAYADDTLIVITFDQARAVGPQADFASCCGQTRGVNEPENTDPQSAAEGGGHVGALLLSPRIEAGRVSNVPYNHFSLLRTIEDAFGLKPLGLAGAAALEPFGDDIFGANPAG